MRRTLLIPILCVALLFTGTIARADSWTFATIPTDGAVSGPASSNVGWGYTITNDSSQDWLVLTNLIAGNFQSGTPTDIFDYPILAPGVTVTENFDTLSGTGLYSLQWNPDAPLGFTNTGNFIVSADFYNGDPLTDGALVASAADMTAAYAVTVGTGGIPVPTPEPAILFLIGLSGILAGAGLAVKKFIW